VSQDPLIGCVIQMPDARAEVLDIEHEFDDGTTLRYVDGPFKGSLTMRDTFNVRRYAITDLAAHAASQRA
jgi:hypothetical protein